MPSRLVPASAHAWRELPLCHSLLPTPPFSICEDDTETEISLITFLIILNSPPIVGVSTVLPRTGASCCS